MPRQDGRLTAASAFTAKASAIAALVAAVIAAWSRPGRAVPGATPMAH